MLDNDILARFFRRLSTMLHRASTAHSHLPTYLSHARRAPTAPPPPTERITQHTLHGSSIYRDDRARRLRYCTILYSATVHGLVTFATGLCSAMLGGGPLGGGGFGEFPCVITETRSSWRLDGGGPSVERADDVVVRPDDMVVVRPDDTVVVRSDHVGGGGMPAEPPSICRRTE